jgi:hypothetical protein
VLIVGGFKHNVRVKIFISSVRNGLEAERDALPGLVMAMGHEPVRFEDFTAQLMPSREACIRAVEASDAYLLLLGPHYGTAFPETQHSATHDEWITAERLGKPRFVLRKTGVEFDLAQQEFERTLGDYGSGRFFKFFATVAEAQQAAAGAIRALEQAPRLLEFEPLDATVDVAWLQDANARRGFTSSSEPLLEVHMVPLNGKPLSSRLLEQILAGVPSHVRSAGLVSPTEALDISQTNDGIQLDVPAEPAGGWNSVRGGSLASVRVLKSGQTAVAFRLPGDQMGKILDPGDATARVASALRLVGQLDMTAATKVAIGIGLSSQSMVAIGLAGQPGRNSVSVSMGSESVHVVPDESMTRAALDRGADEVAATLVRSLIRLFTESRQR